MTSKRPLSNSYERRTRPRVEEEGEGKGNFTDNEALFNILITPQEVKDFVAEIIPVRIRFVDINEIGWLIFDKIQETLPNKKIYKMEKYFSTFSIDQYKLANPDTTLINTPEDVFADIINELIEDIFLRSSQKI